MTRSAQQDPASPGAESEPGSGSGSGSGGEETAAAATVAEPTSTLTPEPESAPAAAKTVTGARTQAAEAENEAAAESEGQKAAVRGGVAQGATAEAGAGAQGGEALPGQSEAEGDPGAAAVAQSRLPALVRTMTATAIDRPQQRTGPVGRPGKAVLAGAAVAGALLVSVPLLMLGGNDDKDPKGPASGDTVLGGSAQDAPGDFAVTSPDTGSSDDGGKKPVEKGQPARNAATSAPAKSGEDKGGKKGEDEPKKSAGQKDEPKKQDGGKTSGGDNGGPAKAGSGVTLSAPVSLRSHLSGRCIDVPGGDFGDGKKLFVWDCNNGAAQKWQFASDGTVRIKGLCLDVANANYNNGAPIQIARCSGNDAQKFVLNSSHDLVNTVVGKCVDIKDNNRDSGAWLQLWSCAGTDNQKWSI
ncbi:RICIN domain-containing protein [Streptomyces phaeochromogenes]|uniref:RICIN domain-containing protein n=1 Tax=Streptomyces phaeochromogenes TaxID=1923 RepID=UPI0033E5D64D